MYVSSSFLSITMYMSVDRISDPGIRHILESPSGASLRELNLTNCYKISDVTLLRLSQRYVHTYVCICTFIYVRTYVQFIICQIFYVIVRK